jgi:hypothetical protein
VGVTIARGLIGGFGLLMVLGGIGMAALDGQAGGLFSALFLFIPGAVIIAGVLLERTRYRSLRADERGDGHGPGGSETQPLDARFRPTEERFVDPTMSIPMQVWLDPGTGERRYVPLR